MPDNALVKNAADREQVKKSDQRARERARRDIEDLRWLLGTIQGRRFVWRYLGNCKAFECTFEPSGSAMYFREGARNIAMQMLAEINEADPQAYLKMLDDDRLEKEADNANRKGGSE